MQGHAERLMFLPGASGNTQFWRPVGARLRHPGARHFLAWPGLGGVPPEPGVSGIADLVARVVGAITGPVALLAQSMGGVIAVRATLEKPDLVRHLVLSVTSGGIDVIPVLLLWGDADPISPVAVGRRLAELFPRAELVVVEGGTHDLVGERVEEVVQHIDRHLAT